MAFLIRRVFVRAAGGGEQGFGCGGVVRLQFLFQVQCVLVGGVEKELNHRLCVCVCVCPRLGGVLLLAALSSPAAPPPHLLLQLQPGGVEEGGRGKKATGRENE